MKILFCFVFFFAVTQQVWACKRTPEAYEKAVKEQIKLDWKGLPQFHLPEYKTLPYTISSIHKDKTSENYILTTKRGQTICRQITYGINNGKFDCSISTTLLSIQGCPN